MALIDGKLFISETVYCELCDEGEKLHKAWVETIEQHYTPEVIYASMKSYFKHKNGITTKNYNKLAARFCPDCSEWFVEAK